MNPRFHRIPVDQMTPLQREVAAEIAAGPRGDVRGPFIALLHHPELARRIQGLGEFLRFGATLPQSLIEMAILITARHWTAQHEWYAHERLARKDGLDEHVIAALQRGVRPDPMTDAQREVYEFCVEAHAGGRVSDGPYAAIKARFGYWPEWFVPILKSHYGGKVPRHLEELVNARRVEFADVGK